MSDVDYRRLAMPIGEAMFTQRAIRRFKPDAIPMEDLRLVMEAAFRAPNGGNRQIGRFLLITDRAKIRAFGKLYHEAWWAKRADEAQPWKRREEIPEHEKTHRSAARLADEIGNVPAIAFALALPPGHANSVIPAAQNLMLAARALGIGSVPTTLHAKVMDRFHAMFGIPKDVTFHFCIPLGYPEGHFGPNVRLPTTQTTFLDRWDGRVPWS